MGETTKQLQIKLHVIFGYSYRWNALPDRLETQVGSVEGWQTVLL